MPRQTTEAPPHWLPDAPAGWEWERHQTYAGQRQWRTAWHLRHTERQRITSAREHAALIDAEQWEAWWALPDDERTLDAVLRRGRAEAG